MRYKKFKVNKIVEAIPATKSEAEETLGVKIKNTLYSDQGYIINNKWIPIEALEAQAVPFDTKQEVIEWAIGEIKTMQKLLENCVGGKKETLITEIKKLNKILKS